MSTDVLEDVEVNITTTNDGDHDRFQHYFRKSDIEANIFHGIPMTALCGKVVFSQVDPKGRTVCQSCKDVYDLFSD